MRTLNLATQPFRNERVHVLLATSLMLAALGATAGQALALRGVLPAQLGQTEQEIRAREAEIDHVGEEKASLRTLNPSDEQLKQWTLLRELVDHRVFRWTVLLTRLQEVLPSGVRVVSIEPQFEGSLVNVNLSATADARGSEALWQLVAELEKQPDFANVLPATFTPGTEGDLMTVGMRYLGPPKATAARSAAAPGPSPAPASSPARRP